MGEKKKQRLAKLIAAARGYRDQIGETVDGIDRMTDLRARQLDHLRLDGLLARASYEDLDAAIVAGKEGNLRRTLAPYVRAEALLHMFVDYSAAGPEPRELIDLEVAEERQDLAQWCGLYEVGEL